MSAKIEQDNLDWSNDDLPWLVSSKKDWEKQQMVVPQKVKPRSLTIDFTNVEDKRQATHIPPGDYIAKILDYEIKSKKDDEDRKYINWKLSVISPEANKGAILYHITSLVPESLWNLRNLLEDVGFKVPKKAVDVPLEKAVNREVGITVDDDEYDNKIRSKVQATFSKSSAAEVAEVDADEEEVATIATDDDEDTEELDLEDL